MMFLQNVCNNYTGSSVAMSYPYGGKLYTFSGFPDGGVEEATVDIGVEDDDEVSNCDISHLLKISIGEFTCLL